MSMWFVIWLVWAIFYSVGSSEDRNIAEIKRLKAEKERLEDELDTAKNSDDYDDDRDIWN